MIPSGLVPHTLPSPNPTSDFGCHTVFWSVKYCNFALILLFISNKRRVKTPVTLWNVTGCLLDVPGEDSVNTKFVLIISIAKQYIVKLIVSWDTAWRLLYTPYGHKINIFGKHLHWRNTFNARHVNVIQCVLVSSKLTILGCRFWPTF